MPLTHQKSVYIRTFGCQMNEHDSTRMRAILAGLSYKTTDDIGEADLILFNTCTIREKAHHKAMSEIGRTRLYKKARADLLIGVCGCVAQEEKGSLFERYPHVDLMFGPDQIAKLPTLIKEAEAKGRAAALDLIDASSDYKFLDFDERRATSDERRATVFVSIMKGCNCVCSYCIVPKVRGREASRRVGEILSEVRVLAQLGTKEVVLLGQNVNAYKDAKLGFAGLIGMIADETEICRIRFTSPHPKDVKDDLIREFAENDKLMPHIHLPLQAGSNTVLKKMHRGYTRERYLEIAATLKNTRPGFSITTDLIVGFCGETEKDFEETLDLMCQVEFDSCFAFKYSPRPGTRAATEFEDDVPVGEKKRRLETLLSLQREISAKKNAALVGTSSLVLVTGLDKMKRGLLTGRLPDNRIIHFSGNPAHIGDMLRMRVQGARANSLIGEVIE